MVSDVDKMESALRVAGRPAGKVIYPNAAHGFLADYRPTYNAEAAKDGWARCLGWFQTYLKA